MTPRLEPTRDSTDATAASDAPSEGSDLPELDGWERCDLISREELESYLADSCMEGEVNATDISRIEFRDEPPPDGRELGYSAPGADPRTGMEAGRRVVIYRHDGFTREGRVQDTRELKVTIAHEVAHSIWDKASPEARAWYAENVYAWKAKNPELTPDPTDYARESESPEEHFCEVYGEAMADPRYVDKLDSYRPPNHSFQRGMARIRNSAAGVER